ncbi:unnamed protein product, partial [Ectocarpus sp. 4 AP-2014]
GEGSGAHRVELSARPNGLCREQQQGGVGRERRRGLCRRVGALSFADGRHGQAGPGARPAVLQAGCRCRGEGWRCGRSARPDGWHGEMRGFQGCRRIQPNNHRLRSQRRLAASRVHPGSNSTRGWRSRRAQLRHGDDRLRESGRVTAGPPSPGRAEARGGRGAAEHG